MPEVGLMVGDILLVDRALKPKKNDLVVVAQADDPELKIIRFEVMNEELELWGTARHIIRSLRP